MKRLFSNIREYLSRPPSKRRLVVLGLTALAFLILTPAVTYAHFARDIAERERIMNRNNTDIVLRDREGEIFYKFGQMNTEGEANLAQVADVFEKAVVASEDREFYKHEGYSLRGIAAAIYANTLNKDATRYGGSTITQQLVKNKLLTADKNFLRKYQEVSLAVAIERRYTKAEILEMYINSVYFGEGAFGIKEASRAYFGKTPDSLTLSESSMLVGILPAPTTYSPISGDRAQARKQQERVLRAMAETGAITKEEMQAALAQEITYNPTPSKDGGHARHFATMVIEDLQKRYGEEKVVRSGYDVVTTLDIASQKRAEEIVRQQVDELGAQGARNAGLVAIDPKNGEVRTLVGSVNWNDPTFGKVNMALSPRQPGSSFKPIYYAEALERKVITPATILHDKATDFGDYRPTNYDFKYRGDIAARNALALSLNVPAVEVMQKLGLDESVAAAQRLGISTVNEPEKYGLSLALGTAEVRLYDMVNAYAAFANGGEQYQPTTILKVSDKYGNEILAPDRQSAKRIMSPEASYLISSILSDNQARAPTFGSSLNIAGRQAAVKTGTTNDNKDAWTVGYTPGLALGVWMGNNENQPMRGLAGSSSAGIVWRTTMTALTADMPKEEFARPAGVVTAKVCSDGKAVRDEVFISGTQPSDDCRRVIDKIQEKLEEERRKMEERMRETLPKPEELEDSGPPEENGNGNNGGGSGNGNTDVETPQPDVPAEDNDETAEPLQPEPAPQPRVTAPGNRNGTAGE